MLLQPDDGLLVADDVLRQPGPVDHAIDDRAGKRLLDERRGGAGIEPMHRLIGIVHRHAGLGKQPRGRRLAHADRTGEAENDHVLARMSATTRSRNSADTSGSTPNHLANAGAAWCSSMPSPSTVFSPHCSAASSSGVRSGT